MPCENSRASAANATALSRRRMVNFTRFMIDNHAIRSACQSPRPISLSPFIPIVQNEILLPDIVGFNLCTQRGGRRYTSRRRGECISYTQIPPSLDIGHLSRDFPRAIVTPKCKSTRTNVARNAFPILTTEAGGQVLIRYMRTWIEDRCQDTRKASDRAGAHRSRPLRQRTSMLGDT